MTLLLSGRFPSVTEWRDQVLIVSQDSKAVLVDRKDKPHAGAAMPWATSPGFQSVATADGMEMRLVLSGNALWLWRRPDEAPIALPANTIEPPYQVIALDDEHLLGVGANGARDRAGTRREDAARAAVRRPVRYLAAVPPPTPTTSQLQFVSAGCREQVRRGEAPDVLRLTRSWAAQPDRVDYGRGFDCAVQDPSALKVLPRWLEEKKGTAGAVCYQSLADWPGAENGVEARARIRGLEARRHVVRRFRRHRAGRRHPNGRDARPADAHASSRGETAGRRIRRAQRSGLRASAGGVCGAPADLRRARVAEQCGMAAQERRG